MTESHKTSPARAEFDPDYVALDLTYSCNLACSSARTESRSKAAPGGDRSPSSKNWWTGFPETAQIPAAAESPRSRKGWPNW